LTIFALSALPDVDTVILGGQDRGYHFQELAQSLASYAIPNLILFPETGDAIAEEVSHIRHYKPHMFHAATMDEAVAEAFAKTRPGKICLLSPGARSYLMYTNLHERGVDFVSTIKRHAKTPADTNEESSKAQK
jgi:UDP-N-acetylmuramoyl-L-alanine---L-glutamate ligase